MIKDFHALVHADDTLIISTSRDEFIVKCNHMLQYFKENSLKLNFDKSSYFILNPKRGDRKTSLQLKEGMLKYKSVQDYLGVIVTDGGVLKHDITKFIREKRSNVLIKFINFCSKNFLDSSQNQIGCTGLLCSYFFVVCVGNLVELWKRSRGHIQKWVTGCARIEI